MKSLRRRPPGLLAFLVGLIVLAVDDRPARAQFGMGMGWGWGGFGAMPSASTTLLNDHALARTAAAAARTPGRSHSPYSNNPNSYINRVRDNGLVSHTDPRRRQPASYRPERLGSLGNSGRTRTQAQGEAAAASPRTIVPLGDFFDASLRLVWPEGSPSDGELRQKRETSDEASLAVLNETKQQGPASVTTVTEARYLLVEYGRPALREIRAHGTPPIADSFHQFLLSLYDSLAEATSSPETGR